MEEFTNTDYTNKNLEKSCFDEKDLCGADFGDSNLRGSTFRNSNLKNTDFKNSNIKGCKSLNSILTGADFEGSESGVNTELFVDLLFGAIGFPTLIGVSAIEGGSDAGVSIDASSVVQSVGGLILAVIFSFAGSILFLVSSYQYWKSHDGNALSIGFMVF